MNTDTPLVVRVTRPRRLVFSFSVDVHSRDGDRVTVEIVPVDGGSELTLTHEMLPEWAEYAGRTESGWSGILEGLAATIEAIDEREGHVD